MADLQQSIQGEHTGLQLPFDLRATDKRQGGWLVPRQQRVNLSDQPGHALKSGARKTHNLGLRQDQHVDRGLHHRLAPALNVAVVDAAIIVCRGLGPFTSGFLLHMVCFGPAMHMRMGAGQGFSQGVV